MKGTTKEKLLSALKERSGEIPNDLALLTILRELAACGLLDGAKAFLKTGSRPKRQTPGKAKRSLASQSLLLGATLGIGMLWVPEPAHGGFLTVPGGSCTSPGCTYSNPGGSCNFSQLIGCLNVTGVGLVCNSFIETCNDSSGHTVEYCIPQNACT
jgi:hypothetical protein